MKQEKYGFDKASVLVDDWWDMFDFPENELYKEALIEIIKNHSKNVVRKCIKDISYQLKPKYLPSLSFFKDILDDEQLNQKRNSSDWKIEGDVLSILQNSDNAPDDMKMFIKGVKTQLKRLHYKEITHEEYIRSQATWFRRKGLDKDADYMDAMADRVKKGLNTMHSDEWDASLEK